VMPPSQGDIPTTALPPTGGPYDPGPPYGGGGGGGGGGGDEPPLEPEPEPEPWYRQPGPLAALIAGIAAVVVAIIALLVWARDDNNNSVDTLPPVVSTSTSVPTATTAAATTTTEPATTTSSSTTTSTTTTTTEPPTTTTTTLPPTTTTTTLPPTTTTTTPITSPPVAATAWDYVLHESDLSDFREAVQGTPFEQKFRQQGLFTFLIPNNDAFPPSGGVDWDDYWTPGALTESQILGGGPLTMSSGKDLAPDAKAGSIGGAKIVTPDQSVGNGIVQVLDDFVTPNQ
jgi:hypothetical protein